MTIASLADYRSAFKQTVSFTKTDTNNTGGWTSGWRHTGSPAAGGSPGNTANGAVPTDATTGAPNIVDFTGTGYLTRVEASLSVQPGRIMVADRLFHVGVMTVTATTTVFTLTSQPSFSGRLPVVGGNPDYSGLWIFYETSNANGANSVTVTYTDDQGNPGHVTNAGNNPLGNTGANFLNLAAGDRGIQKIESISVTNSASGFSTEVVIIRPLFIGRVPAINRDPMVWQLDQAKMPQVFSDSCLMLLHRDDTSTNAGYVVDLEIASA